MGTIQIDGSTPKLTIGNATAEDALIVFDGNAQDFYIGLDDSADDLVIGLGSAAGTTPAISINEDRDVTISDGAIDFDIASHDTSNGLKLGGTLVTATAAELNIMDGVGATASEINLIDGSAKSTSSITIADADGFIVIDGTTTKQIPASDIKTYAGGAISALNNATQSELVTVGSTTTELDAEANLTFTGSALTCIGTITVGVDNTGHDVKYFGATSGSFLLWDESADSLLLTDSTPIKIGDAQDLTLYHDGSNSYITNAVGALKIATETSGIALTIGHTTSETTIADNLTVTGTATITSGQIVFPASQNASTDANTLDDYEEGTWTPAFTGASSNPSGSFTEQHGEYIKIGRYVWINCIIHMNASGGSGGGSASIGGLPIAPDGDTTVYYEPMTIGFTFGLGTSLYQAMTQGQTAYVYLLGEPSSGARVHVDVDNIVSSDCRITISGHYKVAS